MPRVTAALYRRLGSSFVWLPAGGEKGTVPMSLRQKRLPVKGSAILLAAILAGWLMATPALAGPGDGLGTMTISPDTVAPDGTVALEFTFTAGAQQMTDGSQLRVTVHADWTAPQNVDAALPGFVALVSHACQSPQTGLNAVSTVDRTILFDIKCQAGDTLVFTMSDVTAPSVVGDYEFRTETYGGTGSGAFADLVAGIPEIAVGGPVAEVSTTDLAFGNQRVGTTSAPQSVTVTNVGTQPITIDALAFGGVAEDDYSPPAAGTTCAPSLVLEPAPDPDDSCVVNVTFTPSAAGARPASLTIDTDANDPVVNITGTGTVPGSGPVFVPDPPPDDDDPDDDIIVLPEPPIERLLVCPSDLPPAGFADVPPGHVHEGAIDCIHWWGITVGTSATTYSPAMETTRGQMASLVARLIEVAGGALPAGADAFTDDDGHPHEANINRLAAAGIVNGVGGGRFEPNEPIRRDQMASVLIDAYAYLRGDQLIGLPGRFTDTAGNVHEDAINAAAEFGMTLGRTDTTYGPADPVRRDQMASFLVRLLELAFGAD